MSPEELVKHHEESEVRKEYMHTNFKSIESYLCLSSFLTGDGRIFYY